MYPELTPESRQYVAESILDSMNIWLVTIGEPVPLSSWPSRPGLHRTGFLAQFLAKGGHRVLWWTSAFDHFHKTHIAKKDETVEREANLRIRLLRGRGYQRNVSLARLRDHAEIARKFAFEAERERLPDLIVSALPTIDLSAACTDFGMRHDVPVALDMRDMWPDIFVDTAPGPARPAGACSALQPMFRQARRACAGASAITGITEAFVDWGVQRGGRQRSPLDRAFPLGYSAQPRRRPDEIRAARAFSGMAWASAKGARFNVCYFWRPRASTRPDACHPRGAHPGIARRAGALCTLRRGRAVAGVLRGRRGPRRERCLTGLGEPGRHLHAHAPLLRRPRPACRIVTTSWRPSIIRQSNI